MAKKKTFYGPQAPHNEDTNVSMDSAWDTSKGSARSGQKTGGNLANSKMGWSKYGRPDKSGPS